MPETGLPLSSGIVSPRPSMTRPKTRKTTKNAATRAMPARFDQERTAMRTSRAVTLTAATSAAGMTLMISTPTVAVTPARTSL